MNNLKIFTKFEESFKPRQMIANILSISRAPIGIFIFLQMTASENLNGLIILASLICALITDYLDGKIARGRGSAKKDSELSSIGRWLDAFSDFILFFFIYLAFHQTGHMTDVLFALFLAREIMMYLWIRPTAIRLKIDHGARLAGKVKTVLQFAGVSVLLLINSTAILKLEHTELKIVTSTILLLLISVSTISLIWYWKPVLINWPKEQNKIPQQVLVIVMLLAALQLLIYIFLGPEESTPLAPIIVIIIFHIIIGSCLFWRIEDFKLLDNDSPIKNLTLPLMLTLFRLSSIPTLVFLINEVTNQNFSLLVIALLCIVLVSDLFDGKIARKTKKVTKIGTCLDVASDYLALILLSSTLLLNGSMPWWLWIAVVIRFSFTAIMIIILARTKKSKIKATFLGKLSVAFVMLIIPLEVITYSEFIEVAVFLTSGKHLSILTFIEIFTVMIVILSLGDKIYYMSDLKLEK